LVQHALPAYGGRFGLAIVGGGPAGLSPLLAAHRAGLLHTLLDQGVVVIEQSDQLGCGTLGEYEINSDSTGTTFADCLTAPGTTLLTALRTHPLCAAIAEAGDGPVPLARAGRFLALVGETLGAIIAAHPSCAVLTGHRAVCLQRQDGGWRATVQDRDGRQRIIAARHVVSATGASQPKSRLLAERLAGADLAVRARGKLLQSGEVFTAGGLARLGARLAGLPDPRVAIVGGSTSAAAVAHALLNRMTGIAFQPGAVTILHRRALRITYASAAEALAEGYAEFGPDDICPVSGRVFRFAGFRLDSRELIMQARGIGGRAPEPRLHLHHLQGRDRQALAILDRADIVVAALGYRPTALPVFGQAGDPIVLHKDRTPNAPLVDGQCRILDWDAVPLPGLFGIGLAAGFRPRGKLGGEPSFSGQVNGLWLWQNDVGMLIVNAVLDASEAPAPSPAAAIPLMRPNPPRLSESVDDLRAIEDSRIFSNFGPVNTRFERRLLDTLFDGTGACVTVCNATIGLMMAIRHATAHRTQAQRYALMPSFTFAATAQAAIWCGLTPLFCDIDPATWSPDAGSEEALLRRHAGEIAVVIPYATFGYDIDLARYERLWSRHGVPVVVDAAASLGTLATDGRGFGTGFAGAVVYSMHATKSFATGEGGLIYSADTQLIQDMRIMANFGFGAPRSATMIGLNAKMSEVNALLGLKRLDDYGEVIVNRDLLVGRYRAGLPELGFQSARPRRQAHQFMPALLPPGTANLRAILQDRLREAGIGTATYFSPHLAEQPYFAGQATLVGLPVTQDISDRMISLPLFDGMTLGQVDRVCAAMAFELRALTTLLPTVQPQPAPLLPPLWQTSSRPALMELNGD